MVMYVKALLAYNLKGNKPATTYLYRWREEKDVQFKGATVFENLQRAKTIYKTLTQKYNLTPGDVTLITCEKETKALAAVETLLSIFEKLANTLPDRYFKSLTEDDFEKIEEATKLCQA